MGANLSEAKQLVDSGEIMFDPAHNHAALGPMAGILSPSMPVLIIDNIPFKERSYVTINEGLEKILRFGAYDSSVQKKLIWMEKKLFPLPEFSPLSIPESRIKIRELDKLEPVVFVLQ